MSEKSGSGKDFRADISVCRDIATKANANLLHAARLLPRERQDFFFASYAAMRLIDDRVDDDFLCLHSEERDQAREAMISDITAWEAQCLGRTETGPLPQSVDRALAVTARRSDLGSGPWKALAEAMRRDAAEAEMADWDDFLRYADGATVAPATIFIYLLAARPTANGFRYELPQPPEHYASELGIFCYLVHILRDLSKDAERAERLVTIPEQALLEAGTSRAGLAEAIRARDPSVSSLAAILRDRGARHLAAGREALEEIAPHLGWREERALRGLIAIYEDLFRSLSGDYFAAMSAAGTLELSLRQRHLHDLEPS